MTSTWVYLLRIKTINFSFILQMQLIRGLSNVNIETDILIMKYKFDDKKLLWCYHYL